MGQPDDAELTARLETLLAEHVTGSGPGAALGVFSDGKLVAHAVRGFASVEHTRPITEHTVFDIASVSKQMTSACALVLSEAGEFDLDADSRDLVPELDLGCAITYRDCLKHLAGLPDYLTISDITGSHLGNLSDEGGFISAVESMHTPTYEPRTQVRYSNTGYVLTALAMYRATGSVLPDLATRLLFDPLSMTSTQLRDRRGLVLPQLAFSYTERDGFGLCREEMPLVQFGDGAVQTNLIDLAKWQGFLIDGRVIGRSVRDALAEPGVRGDGTTTRYGLGLMLGDINGQQVLEHSGGMYGYRAYLLVLPESGVGVGVMANSGAVRGRSLAWAALGLITDISLPAHQAVGPDASGTWFAPSDPQVVQVTAPGNGEIEVIDGFGSHVLVPTEQSGWIDVTRYLALRITGESLTIEDRLGQRTDFIRLKPILEPLVVADLAQLEGSFVSDVIATPLAIRQASDGVEVRSGRATPLRMKPVGRHGDSIVFSSGAACLVASFQDPGSLSLTIDGLTINYRSDRPSLGAPSSRTSSR